MSTMSRCPVIFKFASMAATLSSSAAVKKTITLIDAFASLAAREYQIWSVQNGPFLNGAEGWFLAVC